MIEKAWALYGAVIALSYYRGGKNEPLCRQCHLALSRLDEDFGLFGIGDVESTTAPRTVGD
jgi:hypothetical protein